MAKTPSNMLELGTKAPYFELLEPKSSKNLNVMHKRAVVAHENNDSAMLTLEFT